MRAALAAADGVRGLTSPNPPVGCVILDVEGRTVAVGATEPPGGPHAEVVALAEAGPAARGGTAVVTLEPCGHAGRTGPCAQALLDAGIARVVHAVTDPNPRAAGGSETLRAGGVEVHAGLLADEVASGSLRAWMHFVRTGRPHVTWKYAATVDGRSAAVDGTSKWISSETSRAEVHRVRAAMDAMIVGTGTVLSDDPQLTARTPDGALADRQPLRVVVGDTSVPAHARVLDDSADTLLLAHAPPEGVLTDLAARGVVDVLLEGGPSLAGAFVAAGCVDRVLGYIAPALLGTGTAALGDAGVGSISQAWWLRIEETTMSGPDVRISAVPVRADDPSAVR
ncbi:bifunctional diaminohydroxyphosphoribosylaminopyrimidine deaminase/5-amino-6-(5-phosphoribosylamino)uracil reductase RibD [Allosaccharopolyspora coralli]|uniref:Riboflavin biosynthesis protein RibD n=1 Tax=Allosaccharopolyspora coralli TaxID=2665642 RepID=A0A5Q3QC80_9PSEU|nr:bifunctional diaminohydroxyphosphoribosylaminopyrimidine deaminase/5-amino-6-(5-phosphoribosylamino)uracil reductase RibD [Allosaccharopolyspora coralli]QGK72168.1 bifunctional diaminohydroxyphosphoribosylaminopyrimidine deaminase/5-amino-6-(5-phosphoribosylamino)uracil reductase RibD [Allosaccharopolyspora coralli]